jgi:hypothetical protein
MAIKTTDKYEFVTSKWIISFQNDNKFVAFEIDVRAHAMYDKLTIVLAVALLADIILL